MNRELLLGRDDGSDIVLSSSLASRRHAHVWPHSGGVALEDLGSRNGTLVNGRRVASVVELQDGDALALGDVRLEFRSTGASRTDRAPVTTEPGAGPPHTKGLAAPEPPVRKGPSDGGTKTLALAVLESLVGTAFSQAIGTGRRGHRTRPLGLSLE